MPSPSPCGTFAAYQRHKRKGEAVDDDCAQAARDQKNARKDAKREADSASARAAVEETPAQSPRLEVLYGIQRTLQGHMVTAAPQSIAGIARELRAVAAEIASLTEAPSAAGNRATGSSLDELAQMRSKKVS